jgi:hypothetical protein
LKAGKLREKLCIEKEELKTEKLGWVKMRINMNKQKTLMKSESIIISKKNKIVDQML